MDQFCYRNTEIVAGGACNVEVVHGLVVLEHVPTEKFERILAVYQKHMANGRTYFALFAMYHSPNRWELNGIGVRPEPIPSMQGSDAGAFVAYGFRNPLDYETGLILVTATEDVAGDIAVLGPGVN